PHSTPPLSLHDALPISLPELKGRMDGMAMRVPVPDGSVTDLVCVLKEEVSPEQINQAFKAASESERLHGIVEYTEDPIVSSDIRSEEHTFELQSPDHLV